MSDRRPSGQETNIDDNAPEESDREISNTSEDPLNETRGTPPPVPPPPPPPIEGAPPIYVDKPPEYSEAIGLLHANRVEELNENPPPNYIELGEIGRRDSNISGAVSTRGIDIDQVSQTETALDEPEVENPPSPVPDVDIEAGVRNRCGPLRELIAKHPTSLIYIPLVLAAFVLFLAIFPVSFEYIHYYDIALKRSKLTGWVDFSRTYYAGCYVIGPEFEFLRFPATSQTMKLDLSVTSTSALSYHIHLAIIYQLNSTQLPLLYRKFAENYTGPMEAIVGSTVKNKAVNINMDDWFLKRRLKEMEIESLVKTRLAAYHIDVLHVFLHDIVFPSVLLERMMRRVILDIKSDTERYILEEKMELKRTEQITKTIINTANEVSGTAVYLATKIHVVANASGDKTMTLANGAGLKRVKSALALTETSQLMSYYLLNSLRLLSSKERLIVAQQSNSTKSYNKATGSFAKNLAVAAAGLAKLKP